MLQKDPGFRAVVVVTLAVGIGANTPFSAFPAALIPLPSPFYLLGFAVMALGLSGL